jgi:hypothetical protein
LAEEHGVYAVGEGAERNKLGGGNLYEQNGEVPLRAFS